MENSTLAIKPGFQYSGLCMFLGESTDLMPLTSILRLDGKFQGSPVRSCSVTEVKPHDTSQQGYTTSQAIACLLI